MKTIFRKLSLSTVLCLGITALPSLALADFTEYDYNDDGYWDESEWVDYSYSVIDQDGDSYIDESEFNDYTAVWYEPYDEAYEYSFADYDYNDDGRWDEEEYADAYDDDLFDIWDNNENEYVDEGEFDTAVNTLDQEDKEGLFDWF